MTQGAKNRRRGADAERQVVNYLRVNGYPDARRYLAGDGHQPGDIDAIPGVCIEVKDQAVPCYPQWCRQAALEAAPDRLWVVVRRTRGVPDVGDWPAVIPRRTNWDLGSFNLDRGLYPHEVRLRGDYAAQLGDWWAITDGEYVVTRFRYVLDALQDGAVT